MRLENQVAIVTGAGRGIGKAIAIALAAEGADIAQEEQKEPQDRQNLVDHGLQRLEPDEGGLVLLGSPDDDRGNQPPEGKDRRAVCHGRHDAFVLGQSRLAHRALLLGDSPAYFSSM